MDRAAAGGHLDVVKFHHRNRTEGCTTAAMDGAASGGHLDIVQFLHEHRSEGCTTAAMDGAARGWSLDVVKFLHENRSEGCTQAAMDNAVHSGSSLKIVEFLAQHRREVCVRLAATMSSKYKMYEDEEDGGFALRYERHLIHAYLTANQDLCMCAECHPGRSLYSKRARVDLS